MSIYCFNCFKQIPDDAEHCPYCGYAKGDVEEGILQPGTVLNHKYLIGRTLGQGGFGVTYLSWDQNMETKIAIKEYFPRSIAARDVTSESGNTIHSVTKDGGFDVGLERYVKEASTLSKFFELPGIVAVKDFFYENGTAYIVMEYLDGISLLQYLKENGDQIPAREAVRIMEPVVVSLSQIHQQKLLHRDISPDNIMIMKDGRVKLIDFGAARSFANQGDQSMTVVLKHGYAPLEQYSRTGEQAEWTDVYALCAVLYRMISGKKPPDAIDRITKDPLIGLRKLNRKVPKYISEAIAKGLAVNPADRFQNMYELHQALYSSADFKKNQRKEKLYHVFVKLLIVGIVFLVLAIGCGGFLLANRDKLRTASETWNPPEEAAALEQELGSEQESVQEPIQESIPTPEPATEAEAAAPATEAEDTVDPEIEHGIIVARDGVLNGHANASVGQILDTYSDAEGTWSGAKDEGNLYVAYEGIKEGVTFKIYFQIFANDTFKLISVTNNGESVERYSDFFQNILNEVGM